MTPTVTLNGIPLGGAQSYGWPLVAGTAPHREFWTITERQVVDIEPLLGKPQTFVIDGPRDRYEVKQLYPLRLLPNANPNLRTVEVADRRWLLSREHIVRHFNIRRINGRKRFVDNNGAIEEENAVYDPVLEFARYSLWLQERPWTPRAALGQILLDLFEGQFEIRDLPVVGNPEIRDLRVDDTGDAALAILLSQFPGAGLFIDREGKAIVYDQLSGKERTVLASLERPHDAGTVAGMVDNRAVRPRSVRVLFTPEIECRVDANNVSGTRTAGRLQLDPIAQSVDGKLTVTDPVSGDERIVGYGSWENADALYAAWGGMGIFGQTLTNDLLAVHAASGFKMIEGQIAVNANGAPSDQNARRIGSAVASWRRDFALDEEAFGKLESLKPNRVAILNRLFGTRAPSPVYTDWIRIPTLMGINEADTRGWDIAGGVGVDEPLSEGSVAPATVSEIAPGMFNVEPRQQDWGGLAQATYFGRPDVAQLPSNDSGSDANRTGSDFYGVSEFLQLDPNFRMALVMTATPGLPNNNRRMHVVDVLPQDVRNKLGNVGEGLGPPITVRVPAALLTAKFGFSDNLRSAIESVVLGDTAVAELAPDETPEIDSLRDLLVNEDFVQEFAEASAATVYARFKDRPAGTHVVDMDAALEPTGALSRVRHEMVGGVTRSVLDFSDPSQLANVFRFLDQGVRATVLGVNA